MGSTFSTASENQKEKIKQQMTEYESLWTSRSSVSSQTEVFRRIVPLKESDFTDTFNQNQLSRFFTRANPGPGFNCNHLFRFSRSEIRIPVLSNENYMVTQPLGEPGRDMGDGCGFKVSHLMVITHSECGPITFNEMLPSNDAEVVDLEARIGFLHTAYENMAKNVPVSECGEKVKECAEKHGISLDTGIREFLGQVIASLTEEERAGPPGYVLKNEANEDVAANHPSVQSLINSTFTRENMAVYPCIQGPDRNSQILSHIHGFLVPKDQELPGLLNDNYIPASVILEVKKEMMVGRAEAVNQNGLSRQASTMGSK